MIIIDNKLKCNFVVYILIYMQSTESVQCMSKFKVMRYDSLSASYLKAHSLVAIKSSIVEVKRKSGDAILA